MKIGECMQSHEVQSDLCSTFTDQSINCIPKKVNMRILYHLFIFYHIADACQILFGYRRVTALFTFFHLHLLVIGA